MHASTLTTTAALAAALLLAACGGPEGADAGRGASAGPGQDAGTLDDRPSAEEEAIEVASGPAMEQAGAADGADGGETAARASEDAGPSPAAPSATRPAGGAGEGGSTPATTSAQDRATQILRRVEERSKDVRSMQANFVQSLYVPLLDRTQTSRGRMYQRRPDRFAMRFTEPAGDVMVADGRHFWIYYPSADPRQVIRTSITEGAEQADFQQQFLANPTERYVGTLVGEEAVDGRAAWVLTLVPKTASPYRLLKVWVDKDDLLVRRFEMTEENGSERRIELSDVRVNGSIPDGVFTFTPPAGAEVFDQ